MENLILTVAVLGIAVAFSSPVSVIAVIALISMPAGIRRAIAFLIGWIAAIALITAVVLAFPSGDFSSSRSNPSRAASALELLIGVALVVAAVVILRRPKPAPADPEEVKDPTPEWLVRIVGRHWAIAALAGGLMLTYSITIIAATEVVKAHVGNFDRVVAMAIFAAASILTVAAPVVYAIIAPEQVDRGLQKWKRWLARNSRVIGVVVLAVVGVLIIAKAVYDLLA